MLCRNRVDAGGGAHEVDLMIIRLRFFRDSLLEVGNNRFEIVEMCQLFLDELSVMVIHISFQCVGQLDHLFAQSSFGQISGFGRAQMALPECS